MPWCCFKKFFNKSHDLTKIFKKINNLPEMVEHLRILNSSHINIHYYQINKIKKEYNIEILLDDFLLFNIDNSNIVNIIELNGKKYYYRHISNIYFVDLLNSAMHFIANCLSLQKNNITTWATIYPYLILRKNEYNITAGMLMEYTGGELLNHIKNDIDYWKNNNHKIYEQLQILSNDLSNNCINDIDLSGQNIAWNKYSKRIIYLGPGSHGYYASFGHKLNKELIEYYRKNNNYRIKEIFLR
jgi:hypothetical protein